MFRFRISIANIYIWNVILIVFFCIKILLEFYPIPLAYAILITAAVIIFYIISIQITFLRHIICILMSFMWSFLIAQTIDYYFNIDFNVKIYVYIVITVLFYIWHLLFTENPFNIVSAVSIEVPDTFSSDFQYVPKYIPFNESSKSGSYLTSYLREKNADVDEQSNIFKEKLACVTNGSEVLNEYHEIINSFNTTIKTINDNYHLNDITLNEAKMQIDEVCDITIRKIQKLLLKLNY